MAIFRKFSREQVCDLPAFGGLECNKGAAEDTNSMFSGAADPDFSHPVGRIKKPKKEEEKMSQKKQEKER